MYKKEFTHFNGLLLRDFPMGFCNLILSAKAWEKLCTATDTENFMKANYKVQILLNSNDPSLMASCNLFIVLESLRHCLPSGKHSLHLGW